MLAITREPIYKNKLLLSSLAVFAGFIVTVGIIRVLNPVTDTTSQSTQSSSDRRASSLIPINASDSETSSESGKKTDDTTAQGTAQAPDTQGTGAAGSPWIAPSPTAPAPTSPSQPAANRSTSSGTASTPSQPSATSPTSQPTTSQPTSPSPAQTQPPAKQTCVDVLGMPILCL